MTCVTRFGRIGFAGCGKQRLKLPEPRPCPFRDFRTEFQQGPVRRFGSGSGQHDGIPPVKNRDPSAVRSSPITRTSLKTHNRHLKRSPGHCKRRLMMATCCSSDRILCINVFFATGCIPRVAGVCVIRQNSSAAGISEGKWFLSRSGWGSAIPLFPDVRTLRPKFSDV